jgi:hypothetical protein
LEFSDYPRSYRSIYLPQMTGVELLDLIAKYAGVFVTTALGAGVGAYVGAYLKKKGENLATHEDIDKVLVQVAAVTTTTKEIESKISDDMWQRQRKWDVKREALFEAMKELGGVDYGLTGLDAAFRAARLSGTPNVGQWAKLQEDATDEWNAALLSFKRAKNLALIVCGDEVKKVFHQVEMTIIRLANGTVAGGPDTVGKSYPQLKEEMRLLIEAVRRELGVE